MATSVANTALVREKDIVRFDIHQRIQHVLMMVSFILLVLTGLPLKFHDAGLSQWWIAVWGGIESTRSVHHFAAWVMAFDCLYHVVYIGYSTIILKRPFPRQMIPSMADFRNLFQDLKYYLGMSKTRARYDRFSYMQKFDYWAIFWGMPIMGVSGFILLYPILVTGVLPGWMVPMALVAHTDEAILATAWIFIVHIFFQHLHPNVFPINWSIITGKLNKQLYKLEHPLEYARLVGPAEEAEGPAELIERTGGSESIERTI